MCKNKKNKSKRKMVLVKLIAYRNVISEIKVKIHLPITQNFLN